MNRGLSEEGDDVVEDFARQLEAVCLNSQKENKKLDKMDIQFMDESDDDMDAQFGYEQIPQDEEGYGQLESDDDQDDDQHHNRDQEDTIESIENELAQVKAPTLVLDASEQVPKDTLALIKSIMGNIALSEKATPDWAKSIPESAWLPQINGGDQNDA